MSSLPLHALHVSKKRERVMHSRPGVEEDGLRLDQLSASGHFLGVPRLHRVLAAAKIGGHKTPSPDASLLACHNPWPEVMTEMPPGHFRPPFPPTLVGHQHGGLLVGAGKLPTQPCMDRHSTILWSHGDVYDWQRIMPMVGKVLTNAS